MNPKKLFASLITLAVLALPCVPAARSQTVTLINLNATQIGTNSAVSNYTLANTFTNTTGASATSPWVPLHPGKGLGLLCTAGAAALGTNGYSLWSFDLAANADGTGPIANTNTPQVQLFSNNTNGMTSYTNILRDTLNNAGAIRLRQIMNVNTNFLYPSNITYVQLE